MRDPASDVPHFLRVVRALARVKAPIASIAALAAMSVPASCSDSGHVYGVVFQPSGAGGAGGFDGSGTGFDGSGAGFAGTSGGGGFDGGPSGLFDAGDPPPFDGGPFGLNPDGGDIFDGGASGVEAGVGPDGGP